MAATITLQQRGGLHPEFTGINFPSTSIIPQISKFPSIQKSSNG